MLINTSVSTCHDILQASLEQLTEERDLGWRVRGLGSSVINSLVRR